MALKFPFRAGPWSICIRCQISVKLIDICFYRLIDQLIDFDDKMDLLSSSTLDHRKWIQSTWLSPVVEKLSILLGAFVLLRVDMHTNLVHDPWHHLSQWIFHWAFGPIHQPRVVDCTPKIHKKRLYKVSFHPLYHETSKN